MRQIALIFLFSLVIGCLSVPSAKAGLFGDNGLDPTFCNTPSVRQTVVYIDDMIMEEGQTDWAKKLDIKLQATLAPGERVTVVQLSPANGQSHELWTGCWPAYTEAQKKEIGQGSYLFKKDPLANLGDQQKYFLNGFGTALTKIFSSAKRASGDVHFLAKNAPQKQILRALASDEGRFSNSRITLRAIVYSDMAENSDLGSVFKTPAKSENYGQKLGSYLRKSVFYAFGVGGDVDGDPAFLETTRLFWSQALHSVAASVGGLGADLNVPNAIPVSSANFTVELNLDNSPLDGKLALLTDNDGNLVDSWIGISRLGSASLTGTFRCATNGSSSKDACRLSSMTNGGVATNSPSEQVDLSGPAAGPLSGTLGVKGATGMTFPIKANLAN